MTPQENIELIRNLIKVGKGTIETAKKYGLRYEFGDDVDYIQFVKDKTEALSDMLRVYEEYWED